MQNTHRSTTPKNLNINIENTYAPRLTAPVLSKPDTAQTGKSKRLMPYFAYIDKNVISVYTAYDTALTVSIAVSFIRVSFFPPKSVVFTISDVLFTVSYADK